MPNHVIAMTSVGLNVTMMESHNALHLLCVMVKFIFACYLLGLCTHTQLDPVVGFLDYLDLCFFVWVVIHTEK